MEKYIYKSIITSLLMLMIPASLISQTSRLIDVENSKIKWVGKELSGKNHYGSLKFKNGNLQLNGKIISGNFTVDMNTISVEDLQGVSKQRLEGHLRSDDFFSVEKFSEAIFEINSSDVVNEDGANQILSGNLTIKGITHPAKIEIDNNWGAKLVFDRSKYDVRFRSGNFFQNLGDKLIYDEIVISANIAFAN
ncbi:MAG: YceI family protein [Flavobacteriaceae bacterium]|jgi:polyisoprenoid-binding protein YceI|nr:YceI family protein [Flavobacteriaceae bacterium]